MEIPDIRTKGIEIRDIGVREIPTWTEPNTSSLPVYPPVTTQVGVPIVDIPGCVEAHQADKGKSTSLREDDENGLVTYCDSNVPSFNPISFEPENMTITRPAPVPKTQTPEAPKVPKTPEVKTPAATAKVECPTKVQQAKEPVGTYVEGYRKRVTEYKLIGKECVQITEKVPLPQQIVAGLPSGGQVVQVGGVAVIATTSALLAKPLADFLLKLVRPAIKKTIKKIKQKLGKDVPTESLRERRGQQRSRNKAIRVLKGRE